MPPLLDDLYAALGNNRFGHPARGFASCPSTNAEAAAWAREGAPEGALVITEPQTAGRGRLGRAWDDAPGQNLLLSVVIRPALPPHQLGLVTLAGGVAVAEAITEWTAPLEPRIKWPNDVLLGGRKCCGMLLESSLGPDRFVVLGIGLNVNQTEFPPPLAERATSLRLETGRLIPRTALLKHLLTQLEHWTDSLADDGGASVREAFVTWMVGRGERVTVRLTDEGPPVEGVIEGVDEAGALRFRTGDTVRALHAGEVTFRVAAE
jgi:BirA family biotin operon repressor/biotin-[acetyl-CoA-carboxylase] ligase